MQQACTHKNSWPWVQVAANMILAACIVASAFALVYLKDVYRRNFIAYQRLL
jgi:hypothetical protein